MKKIIFLFLLFFVFSPIRVMGNVTNSEYYYIIQQNGNTIVGINLYGSGEITLFVPADVDRMYVRGGLYIKENESMTIAIGSTESCAIIYETSSLTEKTSDGWIFSGETDNITNKSIMATLPSNAIIRETNPLAFIESGDFTKIFWNNVSFLNIKYSFPIENLPIPIDQFPAEERSSINNKDTIIKQYNNTNTSNQLKQEIINFSGAVLNQQEAVHLSSKSSEEENIFVYFFVAILILAPVIFSLLFFKSRMRKITSRQEQLLQTLTENESRIIRLLLQERGRVKRSYIEKKLQVAKSSLAATLNNLERKKIIEIDRTYNSHTIKLADWFIKL